MGREGLQLCRPALQSSDQHPTELSLARDEAGFKMKQEHPETFIPTEQNRLTLTENKINF